MRQNEPPFLKYRFALVSGMFSLLNLEVTLSNLCNPGKKEEILKRGDHIIIGIHVSNRVKRAPGVQKVLTAFGSCIKTRIGLHDLSSKSSASNGVIIVELIGPKSRILSFCRALNRLEGVEVQVMVFGHDRA